MAKESICRNCFHSYVCEQFNENKDDNNEKCHFANDHYIPRADVAPKSEVERWRRNLEAVLEERAEEKAEVAREIFEEIEREINDALQSNYKVLPQIEESEALWNRVNGKIDALRGMRGFIDELKEKYTEEQNNVSKEV